MSKLLLAPLAVLGLFLLTYRPEPWKAPRPRLLREVYPGEPSLGPGLTVVPCGSNSELCCYNVGSLLVDAEITAALRLRQSGCTTAYNIEGCARSLCP